MANNKEKPKLVPGNEGRSMPPPKPSSYEQRGFNLPTPAPQTPQQSNNNSSDTKPNQSTKDK